MIKINVTDLPIVRSIKRDLVRLNRNKYASEKDWIEYQDYFSKLNGYKKSFYKQRIRKTIKVKRLGELK